MNLTNQVAVVIGAGGYIGQAITEKSLNVGAHVALLDTNENAINTMSHALINKWSDRFCIVPTDVSNIHAIQSAFRQVDNVLGCSQHRHRPELDIP